MLITTEYLNKRFPSTTTAFAMLTDLSCIVPVAEGDVYESVPGVVLPFGRGLDLPSSGLTYLDGWSFGSSSTPVCYQSMVAGRHAFYVLFNPLDALLRPLMQQQFEARWAPVLVSLAEKTFLRAAFNFPAHNIALKGTEGRAPNDPVEWLKFAREVALTVPFACGNHEPVFSKAKWHHVFFVVPDDTSHPLFEAAAKQQF